MQVLIVFLLLMLLRCVLTKFAAFNILAAGTGCVIVARRLADFCCSAALSLSAVCGCFSS